MVTATDFKFSGFQAAAFFANLQWSANKLLPRLISDLSETLDGDPIFLPVPNEAPSEVPRLFLVNKDQSLRFEMALSRVDIRWQRRSLGHEIPGREFILFAQKALASFHHAVYARPGRLALVANRFQRCENPGRILAAHFCKPELLSNEPDRKGPLNRPENFELHAHKRFPMGRFTVNSWIRCKTGVLAFADSKSDPVVFVEQDINTLPEALQTSELSDEDVRDFYDLAIGELETVVRMYFPHPNA